MKYQIQSNYKMRWLDRFPDYHDDGWETSKFMRAGFEGYDELARAIDCLKFHADLARIIWPMRVIDTEGKVYGTYDPEADMRLPGCRWRAIQRKAYSLWEEAGRPEGEDFWFQAEEGIGDHNGVFVDKDANGAVP